MSGFLNVSITHLKSAQKSLNGAKAAAGKHYEVTLRQAANVARRKIRAEMPRAKKSKTHLPPGRKPGMLRAAVSVKSSGTGWNASRTVSAGGMAHVLIPGAKAHEIAPKNVKALHLSSRQGSDVRAVVQHPAIAGHPWVELGRVAALPEIEALVAATGRTIVTELARDIEGGR